MPVSGHGNKKARDLRNTFLPPGSPFQADKRIICVAFLERGSSTQSGRKSTLVPSGHLDFYPFSAQHLGVSGSKLAVDC